MQRFMSENDSVLETAFGSGFTKTYLKYKVHEAATVDFDEEKNRTSLAIS